MGKACLEVGMATSWVVFTNGEQKHLDLTIKISNKIARTRTKRERERAVRTGQKRRSREGWGARATEVLLLPLERKRREEN